MLRTAKGGIRSQIRFHSLIPCPPPPPKLLLPLLKKGALRQAGGKQSEKGGIVATYCGLSGSSC